MVVLGIDVGGTTTAAGAVTDQGDVLVQIDAPTHRDGPGSAEGTLIALAEHVRQRLAADGTRLAAVGVGVPALVDPATGRIGDEVPHVPELGNRPLGAVLAARFGVPVFVDNDVNALALGEARFGAGRGMSSLVVLAPGTGFGSGFVLDGRLVRGARSFGAEFGHVPVKFDGRPCWCGGRGCLAVYASGRGIAEAARERLAAREPTAMLAEAGGDPARITAALVFAEAARGDALARTVVDEACHALGAMIATIVNGLNPELVVVTGGVAASYAALERSILGFAAGHAFARALASTKVCIVPGDKRVSVRGAAALAFYELAHQRAGSPVEPTER
jgi:glucokinase